MLIVLSNPGPVAGEAECINQLFEAGMQHFHLRKPESTTAAMRQLLQAIQPAYYSRIALHQHHTLAVEFGIQRLHFTEAMRESTHEERWQELAAAGYQLSTSLHSVAAYSALSRLFHYAFLGPVFDSISKAGYRAGDMASQVRTLVRRPVPLMAIGGIDRHNCHQAIEQGFDGVAVLGAIWQTNHPLQAFKNLTGVYVQ